MRLTLTEKKQEAPDAVSFIFDPETKLDWQAGQFLRYKLPHFKMDDRGEDRYFSISAAPYEDHIMLTTRFSPQSSSFKKILAELPVGGFVETGQPEGDFVVSDPTESMVFIAGGIGITPFRAILLDLDQKNLPMHINLLYANRDKNFVYKDELEALARKHETFKINYFVSPNTIDQEAIKKSAADITKPLFYVSGPEPMVESIEKVLVGMGIPAHHIKMDFFPGYTWA